MNHSPKKRRNEWPKGIFRDIFVCSKQELSPFGIVFVLSAENFEERDLGTIFGIIKVDDFSENSSYVANLLVSVIKKEYFSKLHRSPEESFEISLRKANLALAELARHGSLDWSGKINFVSGALERNNLHFACLGNVFAFLLRDGQIAEISRDLEEEREAETHPLKTFANISSGKLEKDDKLIFSTGDLNEIFSKEELRQNAAHFSREEFPHFLEVSLEANSQLAGAIVLDFAHEPKIKTPAFPEAPAGRQETLEYAGAKPAKKIDSFVEFPEEPEVPSVSEILPAESREGVPVWKKILFSLKNLFLRVSDGIKKYFLKFFSYLRNFQYRDKVRNLNIKKTLTATYYFGRNAQYSFIRAKNRFQELESAKKKRYAGIFAAAALVLAIALVFAIRSKNTVQPAPPAQNIPVETKPVLALDDIEARSVENIEEVASLPREGAEIAILSGTLYTISGQDKSVVKTNPETKTNEEIKSDISSGNFRLISPMPNLNALFLLSGDNKIITLTPINNKFQENNIPLPQNPKIQDIKSYLTYLYVLDAANNQVYRYPRSEGGFGEGQLWLRAAPNLKDAKGIAINDDLYIAESGKITAYLQGRIDEKINFESPQTQLAVDSIYSEPGMDFVYVLDSKNRRIIRYTKDGKISVQYFSESIAGIKDFVTDEKNKTIYLLKNNQLLKFSAE